MSAANKATIQRLFAEIYNQGDLRVADEIVAPNYICHNPFPGEAPGREGFKAFVAYLRRALADLRIAIADQVAEDDKTVTRFTISGVHEGDFAGIPPTGKVVSVTAIAIHRIVHGQVQECWLSWDALGLMQQLGRDGSRQGRSRPELAKEQAMAHVQQVNWQILLDENEWDRDEELTIPVPPVTPESSDSRVGRVYWGSGLLLCLLAAIVGLRLWMQAQAGLAAVEKGLSHTLTTERRAAAEGDELLAAALLDPETEFGWRVRMLDAQEQGRERALDGEIVDFVLADDRALAQVRLTDPASGAVYRESRFYRETGQGWLRSQPVAELWGESRTLESEYFVFSYGRLDGPAVAEAAPLLDGAYAHMYTTLGQVLPVALRPEQKVAVHLVMQSGSYNPWYSSGKPLAVNSPRLMRLPEGVSDGQALAEFVAASLRRAAVNRTIAPLGRDYQPTPEFLSGLRLWLAWEENLVHADYSREIVRWLYGNGPDGPQAVLTSCGELCELFCAWEIVAPVVPVTFYCAADRLPSLFSLRPPTALHQISLGLSRELLAYEADLDPLTGGLYASVLGQPVAVATLLEYTTHAYGQASVLALLQAAQEGESWRGAVPRLFGVSAAEFEAGWWAWLAEEYGVDTSEFRRDEIPKEVPDL